MPESAILHSSPIDSLPHKVMQLLGMGARSSTAVRSRSAGVRFTPVLPESRAHDDCDVLTRPERLFPLGRIAVTPSATALLDKCGVDVDALLARHQRGDWGCIDGDAHEDNMNAVLTSGRILAMFQLPADNALNFMQADGQDCPHSVLISTNGSRQVTTVLTPEDLGW